MATNPEFVPSHSRYWVITRQYLLPLLTIAICGCLWWLAASSPLFQVQRIECQLDFTPCSGDELLAELTKYQGANLFRLDATALENRLTGADATLQSAVVRPVLPSTLSLTLSSVYPTVAARIEGESQWVTFDHELRVIGVRTVDPNVPTLTVTVLENLVVGRVPDQAELTRALTLVRDLAETIPNISSVRIDQNNVYLALPGLLTAIMSLDHDQSTQIHSLQAVLSNATILEGVHVVDVRFSQPVLKAN